MMEKANSFVTIISILLCKTSLSICIQAFII